MSKAVMLSIQPKWSELIASGRKTIEVRKTRPSIEMPFKCYIYCTKNNGYMYRCRLDENRLAIPEVWNGKVVGEFVCDRISRYGDYEGNIDSPYFITPEQLKQTCLTYDEFKKYGKNDILYGWHISDLVIYDKPRELGEFRKQNHCYKSGSIETLGCWERGCPIQEFGECDGQYSVVTRPPQSWCYVEEVWYALAEKYGVEVGE